jgi:hypothetical protein
MDEQQTRDFLDAYYSADGDHEQQGVGLDTPYGDDGAQALQHGSGGSRHHSPHCGLGARYRLHDFTHPNWTAGEWTALTPTVFRCWVTELECRKRDNGVLVCESHYWGCPRAPRATAAATNGEKQY